MYDSDLQPIRTNYLDICAISLLDSMSGPCFRYAIYARNDENNLFIPPYINSFELANTKLTPVCCVCNSMLHSDRSVLTCRFLGDREQSISATASTYRVRDVEEKHSHMHMHMHKCNISLVCQFKTVCHVRAASHHQNEMEKMRKKVRVAQQGWPSRIYKRNGL